MIPKCCGEVITNTAGGNDFYYCRDCKLEVKILRQNDQFPFPTQLDKDETREPWHCFYHKGCTGGCDEMQITRLNFNKRVYDKT